MICRTPSGWRGAFALAVPRLVVDAGALAITHAEVRLSDDDVVAILDAFKDDWNTAMDGGWH